jgi:hypothetical protein
MLERFAVALRLCFTLGLCVAEVQANPVRRRCSEVLTQRLSYFEQIMLIFIG